LAGKSSTVEVLPEDVLLEIFDFYKLASATLSWGWLQLTHVCRRWRSIVFASQCRLGLQLLCTYETPVKKTLDCWPTIPIVVRNKGSAKTLQLQTPSPGDEESIVTALQHRDRVCEIDLVLQGSLPEKVSHIMQEPFPLLESLALKSCDCALALPSTFLGGSSPRLRVLHLDVIPFPELPLFLSSASNLVDLQLERIPSPGYFSPEALVAGLSSTMHLETLRLVFASPTFHLSPSSSSGRVVLPSLTNFTFRGSCDYSEDFLSRISTPSLQRALIGFFNQPSLNVLQLAHFLGRTEPQRLPDGAELLLHRDGISLVLTRSEVLPGDPSRSSEWLRLYVCFGQSGLDVSPMTQICQQISPFLSSVRNFDIITHSPEYDGDPAQWLGLFRAFSGVEKLHVTWGSVPDIARALQLVTAEIAVDMLPALRELKLDWLASRWREAVCSFIYARSLAGLPAVEFHQPDISV
jgi:hypothetical protein